MADETVSVREIDIDTLVDMVAGEERHAPDVAYEFSNGRVFVDLGADSSIYDP